MSALIYCPFPNRESARTIAAELLDAKLIACANILGEVEAVYEWEGERGSTSEVGVLFKTHADVLSAAVARLEELHPYETPAVLGWTCDAAGESTSNWLAGLAR